LCIQLLQFILDPLLLGLVIIDSLGNLGGGIPVFVFIGFGSDGSADGFDSLFFWIVTVVQMLFVAVVVPEVDLVADSITVVENPIDIVLIETFFTGLKNEF